MSQLVAPLSFRTWLENFEIQIGNLEKKLESTEETEA